ncbi:AI-2E family transporter [Chelativorans sp. J32]|uniref:AI-2E family transporter n=1 Tax=Chelativorans sp. J32 TaxID=935840 RepID=UPI0004ACF1A8|nr:AI-2E family transporter [Chelativorans sp. J32]
MKQDASSDLHPEGAPVRWAFFFRLFLLAAAVIAAGLLVWKLSNLLLLAFGSILVAVLVRSFSALIERYTPLRSGTSLAAATIAIAAFMAGFAILLGSQIQTQFAQLFERAPDLIHALEDRFGVENLEDKLVEQIQQSIERTSLISNVAGLSTTLFGSLANLLLVMVAGIYLAADPRSYRRGFFLLFPRRARREAAETLDVLYNALRLWLLGQLLSMFLVGAASAAGLWLLGIPSALALGVIAGLLEFVPVIGPILGAVPAVALALAESPVTAAWVALLYLVIQQLEGNLIMPLIQHRMVRLPPALTIFAIIGFGLLFGPLGILFATPLLVVVFVTVKKLWVRDTLDEDTKLPGETE